MAPVKLGVVGCGAIAQVQHLPNLAGLNGEFEVTTVCDLSPQLAEWAAKTFHVPVAMTDFRRLVRSDDVEAVLLCHSDPKTDAAVAALDAGKHVLVDVQRKARDIARASLFPSTSFRSRVIQGRSETG